VSKFSSVAQVGATSAPYGGGRREGLSSLLNRTILVSMPALFGDAQAHSCQFVAAEVSGLWLLSDELCARLIGDRKSREKAEPQPVFIPFPQIAALIVAPTVEPSKTIAGLKPAKPASPPSSSSQHKPSKPSHPRKAGS
jgi:hypothetical protein